MRGIGKGHMDPLRTPVGNSFASVWDTREPENKRQVVVSEIAERLRGMSTLMYGMAVGRTQMGDPNADQVSFLAATMADLALALERVHADYWRHQEEQERALDAKAEREAAKDKKKREVRA